MKKLLKILLGLIGAVVLLAVVAAVVLPMMFDTEDLKRTLEGEVSKRTGRDLTIAGDLSFSVFPWLAVEVSDISLTNAPAFGDETFAEVGQARAGVALMPLLRKEIYIDEVLLSGLRLDLEVNEDGVGNWEDLTTGVGQEKPADAGDSPFTSQQIAGLKIEDAQIAFRDKQSGQAYRVSAFNLETGALGGGDPVPLELSMALEDLTAGTAMNLGLKGVVTPDLERQVHILDDLVLDFSQPGGPVLALKAERTVADLEQEVYRFEVLEATIDQDGQRVELAAPDLNADLAAQTLEMAEFSARASGLDITGSLRAQQILDAPTFAGSMKIAEFSPAALMRELDMEPPATADPAVLQSAALSSDFEGDLDGMALNDLALALDDSSVSGKLRVRNLEQPSIRFDLAVDRIDLDRYMAPADEASSGGGGDDEAAIPGKELEGLDVEGTLRVAELRAMGLDLTNATVGLKVAESRLRLHPLTASFYGGTYSGDIGLDASGGVPVLSLNERIDAVVFQHLASDLLGQDTVSGDAFGNVRLTGRGNTTGEVLRSLAGDVQLRLNEGALEGVNVWYEIRKAVAMFKGQPAPEATDNRTVFSRMNLAATVQDGVMNLDELLGQLPFLDLSGGGSIDLASQLLDLDLLAAVRGGPELSADPLAAQLEGKRLPFTLSGPLTDPSIGLDVAGLLKGEATDRLVEKLGEKLGVETTEGDFDSTEEIAAGLLGGLLGRDDDEDEAPDQTQPDPGAQTRQTAPQKSADQAEADAAAAEAEKEARRQERQEARKKARQDQRAEEKEEQEDDEGG